MKKVGREKERGGKGMGRKKSGRREGAGGGRGGENEIGGGGGGVQGAPAWTRMEHGQHAVCTGGDFCGWNLWGTSAVRWPRVTWVASAAAWA